MTMLRWLVQCLLHGVCGNDRSHHDALTELRERTRRAEAQTSALRAAREQGMTRQAALDSIWGRPPGR
jgi:hypothetical protein